MNRLTVLFCSRCLPLATLACGLWLAAAPAFTQAPATTRIGTGRDTEPIEKDWDKEGRDEQKQFESLRKGEQSISDDAKGVLENGAKWYAYRLTQPQYQEAAYNAKGMHELVRQALGQIVDPRKSPNQYQLSFREEFNKLFIKRLDDVMKNRKDIARVNAAMILAQLAATGYEEAADVLVAAIRDPGENDAVRFYAFRGLKELFNMGRADNSSPFVKKEREAQCVEALLDYLGRKPALRAGAAPREIAAINYVRSEAAAALGLTRFPAFSRPLGKKVVLERPTALVLLKIVRRDGVPIQPSVGEQVSAASGLCQLKSALCDEYQPDYAAYQLGLFTVELANRYNEYQQQAAAAAQEETAAKKEEKEEKRRGKEKEISREGWKLKAARLAEALNEFKEDTTRSGQAKYIANMMTPIQSVLTDIQGGAAAVNAANLTTFLEQNPPKSTSLFKDTAAAVIRSEKTGE